jgi:2-iminobutanoate/2-iminopropanoate deaminase
MNVFRKGKGDRKMRRARQHLWRLLPIIVVGLTGHATAADSIEYLNSGKVLPKNLPFSEAVRVGNTVYLSGQIGIAPGTMKLVPGGMVEEARQTMENIKASLEANGYSMSDLVKCTVMLADISEWGAFNQVYKSYFSGHYPARSALGANGLALGARVEVECIAAVK